MVVHPIRVGRFEWTDLPSCVKRYAEMQFHGIDEDIYSIYGVPERKGAIVVVRPDGYVGGISRLEDVERIFSFLRDCIVTV